MLVVVMMVVMMTVGTWVQPGVTAAGAAALGQAWAARPPTPQSHQNTVCTWKRLSAALSKLLNVIVDARWFIAYANCGLEVVEEEDW